MEKIETATPDLTQENIDRIADLFPDVVTESKDDEGNLVRSIDFDALKADLSGEVVEGLHERYQFTWPGKAEAKLEARKPCNKTMRPCPEKSVNWDTTQNLYIEGDNLDALKILRESYSGKIKLIYIDPPYNTGHDFIYDDDFAESADSYFEHSGEFDGWGGRLVANPESNGRFHSDWCSMMYSRLLLARDLLNDAGAVFISIDDNEQSNLLKICDEVFGKSNFVAVLSVQVNPRGRNLDRYVAKTIEPIIVYVKNYENTKCLKLVPKDARMLAEYNREDAKGRFRTIGLRNRNQAFNPTTRPNLYFPLWINPENGSVSVDESDEYCVQRLPLASDGIPTCWTWSKQKIQEMNDYIFGEQSGDGWRVFRKDYLNEGVASLTMAKSLQIDSEFNNDYGKKRIKDLFGANVMSFPKSPFLLRRIAEIGSSDGDIVMDFFSGSATMADAVIALNSERGENRRFIMVQLPEPCAPNSAAYAGGYENICCIGEERIRRAGSKIIEELRVESEQANGQLDLDDKPEKPLPDVGFRVMRIDSSNFNDVYGVPKSFAQSSLDVFADNLKADRSSLDLLFQVLPKFRIPFTAHIETRDICGKQVFDVNDNQLLACFDANVGVETIEEIAKRKPVYMILRDASLMDDATAANFEELFKTFSPDTIRRVI